jgi:hypothetical protein
MDPGLVSALLSCLISLSDKPIFQRFLRNIGRSIANGFVHEPPRVYLRRVATALAAQFPTMNVLIIDDQSERVQYFEGLVFEQHIEVPALFRTYGYNVYVFQSGTCVKTGEDSNVHWHVSGRFIKDGTAITFLRL